MDIERKTNCFVVGAGSWGTGIAMKLEQAGNNVVIWGYKKDVVDEINCKHTNKKSLPKIKLSDKIVATNNFEDAVDADIIFFVSPAQHTKELFNKIKPFYNKKIPVVICSKGMDLETGMFLHDIAKDILKTKNIALLSGPSFAIEVAENLPCAITVASKNSNVAKKIAEIVNSATFRPYITKDINGVAVCGVMKNIIAIATGICQELNFGENTKAMIISRGISEIANFLKAFKGKRKTLLTLSGLGDLILTAGSEKSRNFQTGVELAKGKSLNEISENKLSEGAFSVKTVYEIARKKKIDMPICNAVYEIVYEGKEIKCVIKDLMFRPALGKTEV